MQGVLQSLHTSCQQQAAAAAASVLTPSDAGTVNMASAPQSSPASFPQRNVHHGSATAQVQFIQLDAPILDTLMPSTISAAYSCMTIRFTFLFCAQLEMVSTLTRLLLDSPSLQREFRAKNGYATFTNVLITAAATAQAAADAEQALSLSQPQPQPHQQQRQSEQAPVRGAIGTPSSSHPPSPKMGASSADSSGASAVSVQQQQQLLSLKATQHSQMQLIDGIFRAALSLIIDTNPQRLIRNIGATTSHCCLCALPCHFCIY